MEEHDLSIKHQTKHYYTLGTVGYSIVYPAVVGSAWTILRIAQPTIFASVWWAFGLSLLAIWTAAYIVPEPPDWDYEGEKVLTTREIGYGFLMSLVNWTTVVALDRLVHPIC